MPGRQEIDHGGPSYTADTLAGAADQSPGAEFFTIIGDDAAAAMRTWTCWSEVVDRSRLVVVDRPGQSVDVDGDIDWYPRGGATAPGVEHRLAGQVPRDGRPLDYLVTQPVLDVIRSRGLYESTG